MAYKIQELVESGFDFSQVYPEKQQAVRESTGLDFDLAGVVKFLQRQTNNFTTENPVAKDLDNAVFVLVEKWKSESGTPKAESVEDADKEVEKELKVAEKTEEEKQAKLKIKNCLYNKKIMKMMIPIKNLVADIYFFKMSHINLKF